MLKLFQLTFSSSTLCKPNNHNWATTALELEKGFSTTSLSLWQPWLLSSNGPLPAKPYLGPTSSEPPPFHPCCTPPLFPYYLWWHVQSQAQDSVLCEILDFWGWFILILFYFILWGGSKRDFGRLKRGKSKNSRDFREREAKTNWDERKWKRNFGVAMASGYGIEGWSRFWVWAKREAWGS